MTAHVSAHSVVVWLGIITCGLLVAGILFGFLWITITDPASPHDDPGPQPEPELKPEGEGEKNPNLATETQANLKPVTDGQAKPRHRA